MQFLLSAFDLVCAYVRSAAALVRLGKTFYCSSVKLKSSFGVQSKI